MFVSITNAKPPTKLTIHDRIKSQACKYEQHHFVSKTSFDVFNI